jgi:hypothetical protein
MKLYLVPTLIFTLLWYREYRALFVVRALKLHAPREIPWAQGFSVSIPRSSFIELQVGKSCRCEFPLRYLPKTKQNKTKIWIQHQGYYS